MAKKVSFTQIETAILENEVLTVAEKGFYGVLKSFQNWKTKQCFPSMLKICQRAGVSKNTGKTYREKLKNLGFLDWPETVGRGHSCRYSFPLDDNKRVNLRPYLVDKRVNLQSEKGQMAHDKRVKNWVPNQMKLTRRPTTIQNEGVESSSLKEKIKKEDQDYIDRVIAEGTQNRTILNPDAYRTTLEKKALAGTLEIGDATVTDKSKAELWGVEERPRICPKCNKRPVSKVLDGDVCSYCY